MSEEGHELLQEQPLFFEFPKGHQVDIFMGWSILSQSTKNRIFNQTERDLIDKHFEGVVLEKGGKFEERMVTIEGKPVDIKPLRIEYSLIEKLFSAKSRKIFPPRRKEETRALENARDHFWMGIQGQASSTLSAISNDITIMELLAHDGKILDNKYTNSKNILPTRLGKAIEESEIINLLKPHLGARFKDDRFKVAMDRLYEAANAYKSELVNITEEVAVSDSIVQSLSQIKY